MGDRRRLFGDRERLMQSLEEKPKAGTLMDLSDLRRNKTEKNVVRELETSCVSTVLSSSLD